MRMASVKCKSGIKNDVDFTEKELDDLIADESTPFEYAKVMDYADVPNYEFIVQHIVTDGMPLVLKNTTKDWDREMFSWDFLRNELGSTILENSPRDNDSLQDLTGWTVAKYLDYFMDKPANRKRPRLYGKDMPCPVPWVDYIAQKLDPHFVYRGPCDLLNDVRDDLKALNLMIYVGFGGTYTPGHRDICGSLGHNVMTYAEKDAYAVWFCVSSKDVERAFAFWKEHDSVLLHDNFFMPLRELAKAPFPIYVIKQREGDFVLVPPESTHQVVNMGGRNIKIAWNTVTSRTVEISFKEVIPRLKSLGKPEIYRIKAVTYYSLQKRNKLVEQEKYDQIDTKDFPHLLRILGEVIHDEGTGDRPERLSEPPHTRVCNFCHCDIFNRSFHCYKCDGDKESRDMDYCLECVAEGRGCAIHELDLTLVEHLSLEVLREVYKQGRQMYKLALQKKGGYSVAESTAILDKETKNAPYEKLGVVPMGTIAIQRVKAFKKEIKVHCHQCKLQKLEYQTVTCRRDEAGCCKVRYPHRPLILAPKKNEATHTIKAPATAGDPNLRVVSATQKKLFCQKCLWNRYGIKLLNCLRDKQWNCPFCEEKCNCAACLRIRGCVPETAQDVTPQNHLFYSEHGMDVDGSHGVNDFRPRPNQNAFKKRLTGDNHSPSKKSKTDSLALILPPQQQDLIEAPPAYDGATELVWARLEGYPVWPSLYLRHMSKDSSLTIVLLGIDESKTILPSNITPWACNEAATLVTEGHASEHKDLFEFAMEEAVKIQNKRNTQLLAQVQV